MKFKTVALFVILNACLTFICYEYGEVDQTATSVEDISSVPSLFEMIHQKPKVLLESIIFRAHGEKSKIENIIEYLDGRFPGLGEILAREYFELYIDVNDPDRSKKILNLKDINYGYTIKELIEKNKIPKPYMFDDEGKKYRVLDLSNLKIYSLKGLKQLIIGQEQKIDILSLSNNLIQDIGDIFRDDTLKQAADLQSQFDRGTPPSLLDIDLPFVRRKTVLPVFQNLKVLDLSNNFIESIIDHAFSSLKNLKALHLQNNKISSEKLSLNAFSELSNLEYLNLSHNELTYLKSDLFKGLKKLQNLNLSENKIQSLVDYEEFALWQRANVSSFINLEQLKELNLSNNAILILEDGIFIGLKALEALDLKNNKINNIEDKAFVDLRHLKWLNLSNNNISFIDAIALRPLEQLQRMNLSVNNIYDIDKQQDVIQSVVARANVEF